jgi:Putative MetA-pathway of phenol degradation
MKPSMYATFALTALVHASVAAAQSHAPAAPSAAQGAPAHAPAAPHPVQDTPGHAPAAHPASSSTPGHGPSQEGHSALSSDRSDFTVGASVLARGATQFEIGFGLERAHHGTERERLATGPLTLVRVGVGGRVEVRASTGAYVWETIVADDHGHMEEHSAAGRPDAQVGLKFLLFDQARSGLNLAVVPTLTVPSGEGHFTGTSYDPAVTVAATRHLPRDFGVVVNASFERPTDHGIRYSRRGVSAGLEHRLIPGLGGFIEVSGQTALAAAKAGQWNNWSLGLGFTRRVGSRIEFDAQMASGLTADAPDWGFGFGITVLSGGH